MAQRSLWARMGRKVAGRRLLITSGCTVAAILVVLLTLLGQCDSQVLIERAPAGRVETSSQGEAASVVDAGAAKTGSGKQDDAARAVQEATGVTVVHVDGAVVSPGVFELSVSSPRVRDAVAAAGGLTDEADTSSINLAATVADGQKVYVPTEGEVSSPAVSDVGQRSGQATSPTSASTSSPGPVNINVADAEALKTLPGVGEATALAIIEDRKANGPFRSPEDLMRVSGIGEKKFARLKDGICV